MLDRPGPGFQKIGAERDDVPGAGEVVGGELVDPEDLTVGRTHRLGAERLIADHPAPERSRPVGQQIGEGAPTRAGNRGYSIARGSHFRGEAGNGIVPGNFL
jgi:hypothetical protein